MKLKIMGVLASVLLMVSAAGANTCILNDITLESTVSGSWSSDCNSTHRDGSYAQYYTFTLTGEETIKIDLASDTDTYLYLLEDANTSGNIINFDDDGGDGLNSKIIRTLTPGTYTIEATTYDSGALGDFNLSLAKSTEVNYNFKGTVALPSQILTVLESCADSNCPSVIIDVTVSLSDGSYQYVGAQVDYNDITAKYEYQFDVYTEVNTSITIHPHFFASWTDEATGEYISYDIPYSFGADNAVGGTGSDADYLIENCDRPTRLYVDLSTPLPIIEMDLSDYILPIFSKAMLVLENVPSNIEVYLAAQTCNSTFNNETYYNGGGSGTLTLEKLMDGYEYGISLGIYNTNTNTFSEYRLNDNDGDFTNGGVFVEDFVYDEFTGEPVFDKTIFVTPEDITISTPENLNFGNPTQVPLLYLLLM